MKLDLERVVEIPEGIKVSLDDNDVLAVSGSGKELSKKLNFHKISLNVKDGKVILSSKKATKRESKMMGTINAHLKNMIKGIGEEFIYKMEICNVHFPMNVKIEGNKLAIKSFLGETTMRYAKILENVKIDIKGTEITISSNDIESAGQTAANIEKATKLTGKDRRIFQDGIFITNKCGREI
jgi:large subunit ribosomal protein L6